MHLNMAGFIRTARMQCQALRCGLQDTRIPSNVPRQMELHRLLSITPAPVQSPVSIVNTVRMRLDLCHRGFVVVLGVILSGQSFVNSLWAEI